MHLCYFDENKHSEENPDFYVGGLILPESHIIEFEFCLSKIAKHFFGTSLLNAITELHGKDLMHGKGNAKGHRLSDRVAVFHEVADFIVTNSIPVRIVCIDVNRHYKKYSVPMPEYNLALMLFQERVCEYLDAVDDIGMIFGDYEADEVTKAVEEFSSYKACGKTPMYFGRELKRLVDTVYFTQSHHSRFLQVADLLVYMAGRYNKPRTTFTKWHDIEVNNAWKKIKASNDFLIQNWP